MNVISRHTDCPGCEELRERIAWLESELGLQSELDLESRLERVMDSIRAIHVGRPQIARFMLALYAAKGRPVTHFQLLEAMPGSEERQPHFTAVIACRARKVFGADAIENIYGRGFRITQAGMARIAEILEDSAANRARKALETS